MWLLQFGDDVGTVQGGHNGSAVRGSGSVVRRGGVCRGQLAFCEGRSAGDGRRQGPGLTQFADAGIEHLVLARQHLRLCLVEGRLVPGAGACQQPVLTPLRVVGGRDGP